MSRMFDEHLLDTSIDRHFAKMRSSVDPFTVFWKILYMDYIYPECMSYISQVRFVTIWLPNECLSYPKKSWPIRSWRIIIVSNCIHVITFQCTFPCEWHSCTMEVFITCPLHYNVHVYYIKCTLHYITLHDFRCTFFYTTLHYTTLYYMTFPIYITLLYITLHYTTYTGPLHYMTPSFTCPFHYALHYITITLSYLNYITLHLHYITWHVLWNYIWRIQ